MNAPAIVEAVENPFASAPIAARPANDTAVSVMSAREVSEVQAGMAIAQRFPRNEMVVMDRILQACTRPTLAQSAVYEYARGGSEIRGASIRLAEMLAQYWGHLHFGWKVVEERPGATKVETFCWDLQTGSHSSIMFDVTHERMAHGRKSTLTDPRDIYEHIANAASRRLRACILKVIPGDVQEAAVQQCEKTLVTKIDITPERLKGMCEQFADFGVTRPMIEKRIQRRLEAITPGLMAQLGKIFTSLRDGISKPADWFNLDTETASQTRQEGAGDAQAAGPAPAPRGGNAAAKARIQQRQPKVEPEPAKPEPATVKHPGPSTALQDVIAFSKAALNEGDIDRAQQIALHIEDEVEVQLAHDHLQAARDRIAEATMGEQQSGHEGE